MFPRISLHRALAALAVICLASSSYTADAADVAPRSLGKYTFDAYVRDFGKRYTDAEERAARETLFLRRRDRAEAHNNAKAKSAYTRTVNYLSDWTEEELRQIKGLDKNLLHYQVQQRRHAPAPPPRNLAALPSSLDWREKGILTPVKNQGQCGSCWTFASTETIEAHWAIKTGSLVELSEQFILDCTPNPHECGGTGGCMGGTAEVAYARLKELKGIPSEWTYPYISGTGKAGQCHGLPLPPAAPHSGRVSAAANVTGYRATATNNYADLLHTLATVGPLAISVDAGGWHDYAGGVFDGGNHTNPNLDHLVQLVGYGTDEASGKDYWLIRNSWTTGWGENGYIRVLKEENAPCGIDITPADGNGCKGGPATVTVCGNSGVLYDGVYPQV